MKWAVFDNLWFRMHPQKHGQVLVDSVAEKALIGFQLKFPAFSLAVPRCLHCPKPLEITPTLFALLVNS
jgi:hypothetical protein